MAIGHSWPRTPTDAKQTHFNWSWIFQFFTSPTSSIRFSFSAVCSLASVVLASIAFTFAGRGTAKMGRRLVNVTAFFPIFSLSLFLLRRRLLLVRVPLISFAVMIAFYLNIVARAEWKRSWIIIQIQTNKIKVHPIKNTYYKVQTVQMKIECSVEAMHTHTHIYYKIVCSYNCRASSLRIANASSDGGTAATTARDIRTTRSREYACIVCVQIPNIRGQPLNT